MATNEDHERYNVFIQIYQLELECYTFRDFFTVVVGTCGPMAPDPDTITTAMRALWDGSMFDLDPSVIPMTFNEDVYQSRKPLTIGYYYYMGRLPACYTAHRAVDMAKDHLKSLGHEVD